MIEQAFQAEHFFNRELSWLEFNQRVLDEANDPTNPLLERVKFLSIFSSNLDEFFMVRVAGLREQAFGNGAPQDYSPDGLRAITQLQRIAKRTQDLVAAQYRVWNESVRPQLAAEGIRLLSPAELSPPQREQLDRFFHERAFPILTPMAIDPSHPTPHFHNRQLYLAAMLERHSGLGPKHLFAVVQLPPWCRAWWRWATVTRMITSCWNRPWRPGCRICSADLTCRTGPPSASPATPTLKCWSRNRTTCSA